MSAFPLNRRVGMLALGALALGAVTLQGCAPSAPTAATSGVRFRSIRVDVSPIRASMGDPVAAWLEHALPGALAKTLAPYMAPGGDTLVAQIDYLYLGSSSGGPGFGGFNQTQDTLVGALLVKGQRGETIANVPLRAIDSYFPMAVDQAMPERAYQSRVTMLAQAFAGWVPRQLGL
jgi:hypothetical protein